MKILTKESREMLREHHKFKLIGDNANEEKIIEEKKPQFSIEKSSTVLNPLCG